MKRHHLLFLFAAFIAITSSAQKLDNLVELKQKSENPLFHHLDKAPRTPAFECEGYWAWGSSVVKGDDGKYHMFVSRFPKSLPFHPGWMVASEIVHAVSEIPQGPYRFSEVALPARGAQYWDGRSTHNPRILRQNFRSIFPASQSSIIRLKFFLFFVFVPDIPSSAYIPASSYCGLLLIKFV